MMGTRFRCLARRVKVRLRWDLLGGDVLDFEIVKACEWQGLGGRLWERMARGRLRD